MNKTEVLEKFKECLVIGEANWSGIHKDFNDDKKFIQFGQQLINDDGSEQKLKGRPRFVINKLIQFVKSVSNEQLKSSIVGKTYPIDNGADEDKALARHGVIRGVERTSNAEYAYCYGAEEALTGGMGAWRVDIDYISDKSMDQTMKVNRIVDASTVMAGPGIQPDYSDSKWFIIKAKSDKVIKWSVDYHRLDEAKTDIWGMDLQPFEYEFWYREDVKDTLYVWKTGRTVFKSQVKPDTPDDLFVMKDGKRLSRPTWRRQWTQYRLKYDDYVDGYEPKKWPGKYAGIVICNGREVYHEGERKLLSLCRYTKDSQRLYNFARQEMGRKLGFNPKAMWLAAIEAIPAKYRNMWNHAHEDTYGTLYWNDKDKSGKPIQKPELVNSFPLDPALSQEIAVTDRELKDTTGIQAENLAMTSNATSKVAIDAKKNEGDTNTYDFTHNKAVAVQHTERILLDLTPKVIDTKRQIRYVGEDDAEKVIEANAEYTDKKTGKIKMDYYFSEEEEYDLGVTVGASYDSKRQQDSENLQQLMQYADPTGKMALLPTAVENMDFNGAKEAAKALKKAANMVVPNLFEITDDDEEGPPKPEIPVEVQQQLQEHQEMKQAFGQMQQELQELKSSKDVEFAKLNQQRKTEVDKLRIEQEKVNVSKFEAQTNRLEAGQKGRENEAKLANDKLIAESNEQFETQKTEIEANFQSQMDAVIKKFDESVKSLEKPDKEEKQPITIINQIPKSGGKKDIQPNGKGGYTVETEDD